MKRNYFNFERKGNDYLITNDTGGYCFLSENEFSDLIQDRITPESSAALRLKQQGFIYDESDLEFATHEADGILWNKGYLAAATSLHIFVVTTECNLNCVYCQANSKPYGSDYFMNKEIARKAVDIALQSPEYELSFEFQGGEPLLNFPVIRYIVEYTEEHKENHCVSFSLVSNLTLLTDEMIDFIQEHNISVSTSVDGYEELHDRNRHYTDGAGSFGKVLKSLSRLKDNGIRAGAIETTTRYSLADPCKIVDTYSDIGFDGIFIRPLTPLGRAGASWSEIGYTADEYLEFYKEAFDAIIQKNMDGQFFKENYASILLKKIFGQYVNYMELRSPCGGGIGQLAYYADGNIYTCDEGRMLSEDGINDFCVGNVYNSTYEDIIKSGACRTVCASGILESTPDCCDCVYLPYCGVCPVVNYALYGDVMAKEPGGYKCKINKGILDIIFEKIKENNSEIMEIFRKWVN